MFTLLIFRAAGIVTDFTAKHHFYPDAGFKNMQDAERWAKANGDGLNFMFVVDAGTQKTLRQFSPAKPNRPGRE
jgi:hypothetical protein